jgi:hypothetical protein
MSRGVEDKERGWQGDKEAEGRSVPGSLSVFSGGWAVAIALGWIAARLNAVGFAPVGLLPLAIGIVVGSAVSWLSTLGGIPNRSRLLVAAGMVAILTVLAEHAWLYRDFCRQWREARIDQPQVAMFRPATPWSPAEYFAQEATPGRLTLWCVDAAILVASAAGTVLVLRRRIAKRAT